MSCKGEFHGYVSSLVITDLTDKNDIGILTEDRPQGRGKCQSDLLFCLYLGYSFKSILYRIFYRDDIGFDILDLFQSSMQCCRFTATCRSGDYDNTVRPFDPFFENVEIIFFKAESSQLKSEFSLVKQTENNLLAGNCRRDRYSDVNRFKSCFQRNMAVLWQSPLCYVQFRHHLNQRNYPGMDSYWWAHNFSQGTVNTIADSGVLVERFNVDIGSAVFDSFGDDQIYQLHDGCISTSRFIDIDLLLILIYRYEAKFSYRIFYFGGSPNTLIVLLKCISKDTITDKYWFYCFREYFLQVVLNDNVLRIGHSNNYTIIVLT